MSNCSLRFGWYDIIFSIHKVDPSEVKSPTKSSTKDIEDVKLPEIETRKKAIILETEEYLRENDQDKPEKIRGTPTK